MTEQPQLAEVDAPAPSAWESARLNNPGKKLARMIDVRNKRQSFVVILDEPYAFLFDGSTHFLFGPRAGLSLEEQAALIAECDTAWRDRRAAA